MSLRHHKGSPPKNGDIVVMTVFKEARTGMNSPDIEERIIGKYNSGNGRVIEGILKGGPMYKYEEDDTIVDIGPGKRYFSNSNTYWNYLSEEPMHIQEQVNQLEHEEFNHRVDHSIQTKTLDEDPSVQAHVKYLTNLNRISKQGLTWPNQSSEVPDVLMTKITGYGGTRRKRKKSKTRKLKKK
jgi:hypothetical protein